MKPGGRHSAETRARISAANTGRRHTAETRAKISAARMGSKRPHSAETRAKMSAAQIGKAKSAATRAAMRTAALARVYSPPRLPAMSAEQLRRYKGLRAIYGAADAREQMPDVFKPD